MLLCISDIPAPPTDFNFEVDPDNSRSITVTWTESVQSGPIDEVDEYVVEKSRIGGQFQVVRIHQHTHKIV